MRNISAAWGHGKAFRNNYLAALLVTLSLCLITAVASAQVDTTRELPKRNASYADKHLQADSSLRLPQDTFKFKSTWRGVAFKGTNPYFWDGTMWRGFAATSGSGTGSAIVRGTPPALAYFRTSDSTLVSALNGAGGLFYKTNWLQIDSGKLKVTIPWNGASSDTMFVLRTAGKPPSVYSLATQNGAANGNGQFTIDNYPCGLCPEVGFRYRGDDLGFVRNEIYNMYGGTNSSAAVGYDMVMNAWGQHFQLFAGGGANFFTPNGAIVRSTKYLRLHGDSSVAGVQISAGGLGAPGTNEVARFNTTGVGIGTTSPAKKLHVNGTVRFSALGTATNDSTNFKPLGINSSGDVFPMTYWPGSGGGSPSPTGWDDMLAVGQQQTTTRTADINGNTLNFDQIGTFNVTSIATGGKYNSLAMTIPTTDFQNLNSIAGSDAGYHSDVNTQSGNRSASTWLTSYGGTGNRSTLGVWERGIEAIADSIQTKTGSFKIDSAITRIRTKVNVFDTVFRVGDNANDGFFIARKNDADYFRTYARNFTSTNLSTVFGFGTVFDANAGSAVQFQNNVKMIGNQQRLFLNRSYAFTDADPNNSIGVDINNDTLSTGVYPFLDSSHYNPLVVKFTDHSGTSTEKLKVRADGRTIINGSLSWHITSVSSNTTLTAADGTVIVDATGGAVTINLPDASTVEGIIYVIKKVDASANNVTIDGNGSQTIDGSLTKATNVQYKSFQIQALGSSWYILNP